MNIKDFKIVLDYKNKKGNKTIEDVNEILLSNKYYPFYKNYGVDNFLNYYAPIAKKIMLEKKLQKELALKPKTKGVKI